tara:strand:+ start:224 stop:367 length:144 start_codon:yes stop_codon:yes gene_type:complete
MNLISRWRYIREENKKNKQRALENSWLDGFSKEMIEILVDKDDDTNE